MIVSIDGEDIRTIEELGYKDFTEEKDGEIILKRKDGKCVFLADNKCSIQIKHGYDYKPKICRRFPDSSIGLNQVVCGKFSGELEAKSALKDYTFIHKGNTIASDVLSYTISKLGENYLDEWYTILCGIKDAKKPITNEDVEDFLKTKKDISKLEKIRLFMTLAAYSRGFYPALIKIPTKLAINLIFPCEKLSIDPKQYISITIDKKEVVKFMDFLSKGNGILYKENYPKHLLFCFMFLDRVSKQIAFNNSKKNVEFIDIVNAFSILNSVMKFS